MTSAACTDSEKAEWFHPDELSKSPVLGDIYEKRYGKGSRHAYKRHFDAAHRKIANRISVIRMNTLVEDMMIARVKGEVTFE